MSQISLQVLQLTARAVVVRGKRSYTTRTNSLIYLKELEIYNTVKPYYCYVPKRALPRGMQSNEEPERCQDIFVEDVRGQEKRFTLDKNGFEYYKESVPASAEDSEVRLNSCLNYEDYADPDIVKASYRPAVERLVQQWTGAETVVAFSHDVSI